MAVFEVDWCDFVVYAQAGLFIERIQFGREHWQERLLPCLKSFFERYVVPELLYAEFWFSRFSEQRMDTA